MRPESGAFRAFAEALRRLLGRRRRQPGLPPGGGRPPGPGVREPRRPYPSAGAGAAALPEPGSGERLDPV